MKKTLIFALPMLLALNLDAQTNESAVRLALTAETDEASAASDVLMAQLSGNQKIQLLERNEIEKVYREQGLSAANKDYLKLGRILGADGLLMFDIVRTKQATNLTTRLIAVKPGVVLTDGSFPWPLKDTVQWAESVATYAKTVYYYHLADDGGFAVAQVNIGYLYRDGIGVQRDPVEAMKWFYRAADQGNAKAMVEIGRFYRYGQGVPRDSDEAIRWFQKAADKGEPLGRLNLGLFYYEEGNPEVAFNINQQAADEGNGDAMFMLYRAYWEGNGVAANHEKAMEWLAKAAEGGSATSQCVLGYRYEYPDDDSSNKPRLRNMPEAIKWYRLAAGQNHAGGQYHLGLCHLAGLGVEKDEERGLDLIREAADQNHPDSLLELAKLYARGIGEPRNERDLPMQLLQRAVQNDPQNKGAFDDLIFRYEYGAGMDRDMIAAVEWYCRAALAGMYDYSLDDKLEIGPSKRRPQATYSGESERPLILLRAPDSGEKSDRFLAVMSLYLKAARVNDLQVLMQIGEMYVTGRNDVPKSAAKAWSWFTLAAQRGDRDASAKIAKLNPI